MSQFEADGVFTGQARADADRRRRALVAFRFPERRTGYDRRGMATSAIERALHGISAQDQLALTLVTAVVGANLLDILYTKALLQQGAAEANGFLLYMMSSVGSTAAFAVKMLLCLVVAGIVWALRKYRSAAIVLVAWLAAFTVLIVYQTVLFAVR